ncbi:MAG: FtsW/RodA/SpoVE family cell cycle protein [Paludibacteraceae bacterium]|nr:FtsW/RodA/SpoVE family cell cycle protein [Paludibacteraceae bacterium]
MQNFIKRYIKGDLPIWSIFLFLCIISVIEIYSAGSFFVNNKDNHTSELLRHSSFLLIGAVLAWAVHKMPFKWVRISAYFMLPLSAILLMLLLLPGSLIPHISIAGFSVFGVSVENDAARWMSIMGLKFQPSEFAKISVIIYLADLFTVDPEKSLVLTTIAKFRRKELTEAYAKSLKFWIGILVLCFYCALILPENLSTAVMLFGVGILLLFIANVSFVRLVIFLSSVILAAFLFFVVVKYIPLSKDELKTVNALHDKKKNGGVLKRFKTWEHRIENFTGEDKNSKYTFNDTTAQIIHSQIAIARGGTFGVMPGNSVQRDYLPQAFADFIFSIIVEEMGLIGGVVVMALYMMFLYRAGILAKKSQYEFPSLLVMGLALMLVSQAFVSMAVAVHLGPVTGQPLPLLSRGGTAIIITWLYIGIIQCVARSINDANAKDKTLPVAENYETPYDLPEGNTEEKEPTAEVTPETNNIPETNRNDENESQNNS